MSESVLALVRHGESEWNRLNIFTGWRDVGLSELGKEEARAAGKLLAQTQIKFDCAFTSALKRAQQTLVLMLAELNLPNLVTVRSAALNERDYGDLTGKNKDEARVKFGAEQVRLWRRSFAVAPPGGESLRDTAERVWPFFRQEVQPHLGRAENVLVAAHGNSLRALVGKLEGLSPEEVCQLEIGTGVPLLYFFGAEGQIRGKKILK